jgi:hypothetical protein
MKNKKYTAPLLLDIQTASDRNRNPGLVYKLLNNPLMTCQTDRLVSIASQFQGFNRGRFFNTTYNPSRVSAGFHFPQNSVFAVCERYSSKIHWWWSCMYRILLYEHTLDYMRHEKYLCVMFDKRLMSKVDIKLSRQGSEKVRNTSKVNT